MILIQDGAWFAGHSLGELHLNDDLQGQTWKGQLEDTLSIFL